MLLIAEEAIPDTKHILYCAIFYLLSNTLIANIVLHDHFGTVLFSLINILINLVETFFFWLFTL